MPMFADTEFEKGYRMGIRDAWRNIAENALINPMMDADKPLTRYQMGYHAGYIKAQRQAGIVGRVFLSTQK